jgi:hypothetical protein
MAPALSIDGRSASALPAGYRIPRRVPGPKDNAPPIMDNIEAWFGRVSALAESLSESR